MVRPYKRRCVTRNDDPDAELHERRARNDLRLKSAFESIFEKYGKDFSGIADEINLQTGEIVVNRGHLFGMRNETHPGCEEDLYDELNPDEAEKLNRRDKADSTSLDPDNAPNESIAGASNACCYSEDEPDSLMGDVDAQLSSLEADVNVGKVWGDGHREHLFRPSARPAKNELSKLSWKSRLRSRPTAVISLHDQSLDPSFDNEQAVEPAWRAPPLPKPVPSVHRAASVLRFNPHQMEHERSASPPGASLWAPETSRSYPERRGGRQKEGSSARAPRLPKAAQHPTVENHLPEANVSSLNYQWSISVRSSRPEQLIEGLVPSALIASSAALEPHGTAAWTLEEDNLLRVLKSSRMPYSKMTMYFSGRTEADLEDHWFDLQGLNSKPPIRQDNELCHIDQRTTSSPRKDHQTLRNGSLPTFEIRIPNDSCSTVDLRGVEERAPPKHIQHDTRKTRNYGSEQQSKPRKSFNDLGQPTFATKIKTRNPTSELSDQVNCRGDTPSMSSFPENCNVLEQAPNVTTEKSADDQRELPIQQDRPQDTSNFTNATCKNCFSQNCYRWHNKGGSRICHACYQYAWSNKKDRPRFLQLRKVRKESECFSDSHIPVRRRYAISHEVKASDVSPSLSVPDSQTPSKANSTLQTKNHEIPRTAKSTTFPDDLSEDELSTRRCGQLVHHRKGYPNS